MEAWASSHNPVTQFMWIPFPSSLSTPNWWKESGRIWESNYLRNWLKDRRTSIHICLIQWNFTFLRGELCPELRRGQLHLNFLGFLFFSFNYTLHFSEVLDLQESWGEGTEPCPSVQFSCSVVSDFLQHHGLQHPRLPCPSPTPRGYSKSHPSLRWCHPTISFSVVPLSSCPQSFPASGSFQMSWFFASVQFSRSVMSNSLPPHKPQHARPPCPSPTPGVHPNPCPSSQWCHPATSSFVVPFSSCPQSFPASGSFPMSQIFTSGGQNIGVSASVSVLPMTPRTDLL